MSYATLKWIHVSAVSLSFCGFVARGLGTLRGARWTHHRTTRVLVHGIDTVLLASALGMLWLVQLSPWALPWLRAKIVALLVYIAFGTMALRDRSGAAAGMQRARLFFWVGALVIFGYIVSVAVTKRPGGVF